MLRKAVLALGLSLSLWPINGTLAADAQQAERVYRIGFLRVGKLTIPQPFWDSMREFGWVEGKNVRIEPRYADREDQLPHLALDQQIPEFGLAALTSRAEHGHHLGVDQI